MLIALLTLVIGCTADPNPRGSLTVAVNSTRGLSNMDMVTEYYTVDIRNLDRNISYDQARIEKNSGTLTMTVASGNTEVTVNAYNAGGTAIGTGKNNVNVIPNKDNTVSVTVNELKGSAKLNIEVDTTIKGVTFMAEVGKDLKDPSPKTVTLTADPTGKLKGSVNLDSGFYLVRIKDTEGNYYGKVESVRIFKGTDITYKAYVGEDKFDVKIEIENDIMATPTVTISGGKASYNAGESYSLTASSTGITTPTYQWFLDGNEIMDATGAAITGKMENMTEGKHVITVMVKNDSVLWTANHEFTFNPAN